MPSFYPKRAAICLRITAFYPRKMAYRVIQVFVKNKVNYGREVFVAIYFIKKIM